MELSIDKNISFENKLIHMSTISKVFTITCLGIIVSFYFFPFEFTFLPQGLNTKILLAVLGLPLLGLSIMRERIINTSSYLLIAIVFAVLFSVIGYISVDINNSLDLTYANYFISFSTWLLGAYCLCVIIYSIHGYLNFELLTNYLIGVCAVQCLLALVIDYNPSFKAFIDTYISQDPVAEVEFLNDVNRLYGIGAALDVAGTRFSIVLLSLVAVLNNVRKQEGKLKSVMLYWSAFVLISVIGNMISRTTIVGVGMALTYLFLTSDFLRANLTVANIKSLIVVVSITMLLVLLVVYFYNTDPLVKEQLRFAFEGFFNWVEKGRWYTSSTDRLNSVMWIWPESTDLKTWLIGKATFDDWHAVGTDIGYCRFVFYSGLLGLITFSLFFVYNAWACNKLMPGYTLYFCFLLALSFIIWLKVSTDLFIIYALIYNLGFLSRRNYGIVRHRQKEFIVQ